MASIIKANVHFYNDRIKKHALNEYVGENTRKYSIANTYKNEPEFQPAENLSRNYARSGQQKFEDPFAFHPKPYNWYFEGRNQDIHNTLAYNSQQDYPEVITVSKLNVRDYY
jgi:hypothetical protein